MTIRTNAVGFFCLLASFSGTALACDEKTGERLQYVFIDTSGAETLFWTITDDSIRQLTLENGFKLGIRIEPATPEYYAEESKDRRYVPELVKISLFDMSSTTPKELTHTWGGANSVQGYSDQGGATRVVELGSGITLNLLKPVCISSDAK
jgi:hypothetical protein